MSNRSDGGRYSYVELSWEQISTRFDEVLQNPSIYELIKDYVNTLTIEEKVAVVHRYDKDGVAGVEDMF